MMYFKDNEHEEIANQLMRRMGFTEIKDDKEYGSFCYVASATYKIDDLKTVCDHDGIDLDKLEQLISVYSSSEISIIRFALQLFNNNIDLITIPEVMRSLDHKNKQVIMEAINFRFSVNESY